MDEKANKNATIALEPEFARLSAITTVAHIARVGIIVGIMLNLPAIFFFGWFGAVINLVLGLPAIVTYGIANFRITSAMFRIQKIRDHSAVDTFLRLSEGVPHSPYSLYLRPFFSDKQFLRYKIGLGPSTLLTGQSVPPPMPFDFLDRTLCAAFDSSSPILELCEAGTVRTDRPGGISATAENWQSIVKVLAKSADEVIVIPFSQPATAWEIQMLMSEQLLPRVIFLVPPFRKIERKGNGKSIFATNSLRDVYEQSRLSFGQVGIELPAMKWKGGVKTFTLGALIRLDNFGKTQAIVPLRRADAFNAVNFAKRLSLLRKE